MTREEIIDGLEVYTIGRLKKARVNITVEELQRFIDAIKALEQSEPCEDAVSRAEVLRMINCINNHHAITPYKSVGAVTEHLTRIANNLPPAQPTQLTDDDIETIKIHLSAIKENLCNQHRWNEAKEYEALIDRLTVQPEQRTKEWEPIKDCIMRHENGNCLPAGGFCTANKNICEALHNAYEMGKSEQRTGHWINKSWHGENTRECSVCHVTQSVIVFEGKVMFKFCPYCGSKMEGEHDESN